MDQYDENFRRNPLINPATATGPEGMFTTTPQAQAQALPMRSPLPKPTSCFNRAAERWIDVQNVTITASQKKVLLWIYKCTGGKTMTIVSFYRRITADLGISKKAAISHVAALNKKKLLIDYGSAFHPKRPKQAIGKRFFIPNEVKVLINFQLDDHRM